MRAFHQMQIKEAVAYSASGGQALHLHRIIVNRAKAPRCFINAIERGEDIAHLFDRDKARLIATARKLGVNVILVEREGGDGQHIDLCGSPLKKAVAACEPEMPLFKDEKGMHQVLREGL